MITPREKVICTTALKNANMLLHKCRKNSTTCTFQQNRKHAGAECLSWAIVGLPASTVLVAPNALVTQALLCEGAVNAMKGQNEREKKQDVHENWWFCLSLSTGDEAAQ